MFNVKFPNGEVINCTKTITGEELLSLCKTPEDIPVVAWHVNGYLRSLNWPVSDDADIEWVDQSDPEGEDVLQSSLSFLLVIAVKHILGRSIRVTNSISEGLCWQLERINADSIVSEGEEISQEQINAIKAEMDNMIAKDLPMRSVVMPVDEACSYFKKHGRPGKAKLLSVTMSEQPVEVACYAGEKDMYYSPLVPSTRYLKNYALSKLGASVVLRTPTTGSPRSLPPYKPSNKLQDAFAMYSDWMRKLHVITMVQIWDAVARDGGKELILISEALHAEEISTITAKFLSKPERRVISIAGPSASGKTTTSQKLRIQLQVMGKNPIAISLDDYFVDRDKCPLDENGEYDFEALESINLPLFDEQMHRLLAGDEVQLPRYDFIEGKSVLGRTLRLGKDDVIILEGLHGLNDRILNVVPREKRFGIFLSPMSGINLDKHTRTSTTDHRLLRRMLRDCRTRGSTPESTLIEWPSVVRGAMKYIFPFQGNADVMFNSSLLYELPVMRVYAEILLHSIPQNSPVYGEALRLLRMLRSVPIIDPAKVPSNSLLREFIGGSIIEI